MKILEKNRRNKEMTTPELAPVGTSDGTRVRMPRQAAACAANTLRL